MSEGPFERSDRVPPRQKRGLVGPLILIMVGVALLLNQLDLWDLDWSYVWRLWPLILILMGLVIILDRTRLGSLAFLLVAVGVVVLGLLLLPSATPPRGNYQPKTFTYPAKGLEAATIWLEPGVATLEILPSKDSGNLIDLEAKYDERQSNLAQKVEVAGDLARVWLKSKTTADHWRPFGSRSAGEWRVWLDPEVPLGLEVDTGVSRADLDLADLTLTRLDLNAGVGQVTVVLPGKGEYEAFVNGGVGSLAIDIPDTIEAHIRVDKGVGSVSVGRRYELRGRYYVTEGYKSARDRVDLDIDGGVGSITIR